MVPEPFESYTSPRAPLNDISNIFQTMSVSKTPQPSRTLISANRPTQTPLSIPGPQQQIAMYPMLYHGHTPAANRFLLDHTPTRSQSIASLPPMTPMTPMNGTLPIMGPLYTPPSTPMASDFTSPRSIQAYGRGDTRRHNAMRVSRSPYYNAAGHHNHVDVTRIREGIDVRTTVSIIHLSFTYRKLTLPDHATQHPQQGGPGDAEADR